MATAIGGLGVAVGAKHAVGADEVAAVFAGDRERLAGRAGRRRVSAYSPFGPGRYV
ncbi:hypothetical protein E0500_030150 [Streptomyces sp. KM273126]|uniref:hypothetical protein n=1 Tax=Streptomyces sp. KM273126 TaxID=2545247 RepID=UPI00140511F3|nr:hypothetical protein [Streptomyces sp. KM273126]MBA2811486.1 hypothetical protein [Streptomyces sp. KM273126]